MSRVAGSGCSSEGRGSVLIKNVTVRQLAQTGFNRECRKCGRNKSWVVTVKLKIIFSSELRSKGLERHAYIQIQKKLASRVLIPKEVFFVRRQCC